MRTAVAMQMRRLSLAQASPQQHLQGRCGVRMFILPKMRTNRARYVRHLSEDVVTDLECALAPFDYICIYYHTDGALTKVS
jgi:hypothetical protein